MKPAKAARPTSTGPRHALRIIAFFAIFFVIIAAIVGATLYLIYNSLSTARHEGKPVVAGVTVATFTSYSTESVFPMGLALGADNSFYLTTFGNGAIDKIDSSGKRTNWMAPKAVIIAGGPILAGKDGSFYLINFISTAPESAVGQIKKLTADGQISQFGNVPGGLPLFAQMAFDGNSNLYVTDPSKGQVWRFMPDGTGAIWWTAPATGTERAQPTGLAFNGQEKALYVGDSGTGTLYKLEIGADGTASNPLVVLRQAGTDIRSITVDDQGQLLLAVWSRENGQLCRLDGGKLVVLAEGFRAPTALVYRDQKVYVVNSDMLGLVPSFFFGLVPSPLRAKPPFTVDVVDLKGLSPVPQTPTPQK